MAKSATTKTGARRLQVIGLREAGMARGSGHVTARDAEAQLTRCRAGPTEVASEPPVPSPQSPFYFLISTSVFTWKRRKFEYEATPKMRSSGVTYDSRISAGAQTPSASPSMGRNTTDVSIEKSS